MSEKTPQELARVWKTSFKYAIKALGRYELAEEVAQIVCQKFWLKPHLKQTPKQATIDVLRSRYGATRFGRGRRHLDIYLADRQVPVDNRTREFIDIANVLSGKHPMDRGFLVLSEKWGLTHKEIGSAFGLSESRVCQRLKKLKSTIEKI